MTFVSQADLIWAALILAGAAFEAYALRARRHPDTLSETTRSLFRTRTSRYGRCLFLASWVGFTVWFAFHIMEWRA